MNIQYVERDVGLSIAREIARRDADLLAALAGD